MKDAPGDEISHLYLGEISFEKKDLGTAQEHYEKARKRIGLKAPWILHYAECLLAQNDAPQAADVLNLLPEDDGENRFQAGMMLGRADAYLQAATFFSSARQRYSDPYVAGYNQLLMLIKAKKYPDAIQLFHDLTAQGQDHQRAELYNLVSEAYLKTDRVQEAYDVLRMERPGELTRPSPNTTRLYV